ncbi:hypothetical protein L6452_25036 [Arctium lappa]|uniref:Uncharacterized protein n=1 Tax=Arctium lappa TaxID=4217 RepID=A0ACB9AAI2_ARCLA|nr:hypothetical protein L6452_25036 [Arctium lappa]
MATKSNVSIILFLALHFLFFTMVSSCLTCTSPTPNQSPSPSPTPTPTPTPPPPPPPPPILTPTLTPTCPRDTLKLGVCVNLLRSLVNVEVGSPPVKPCCSLIKGLADLEVAVCLCTTIRANALGININVPMSLSLLLNVCGNQVPRGFQCG